MSRALFFFWSFVYSLVTVHITVYYGYHRLFHLHGMVTVSSISTATSVAFDA